MKHPITAGCCIDVTSRQHQQKTLVLAEQPKRWVDKTALDYKQAFFFFFPQPNVVSCFNCNFQELY